jgi:NAD(P)-dependent dehydrogenase (short-subunit alcohol dehydrogenase family)
MTKAPSQVSLALVTGAAQRVGKAIALELARQGYAIGLHYHASSQAASATADELAAAGAPQVHLLQADLTQPQEVVGLFERVAALGVQLRVLVNSAAEMRSGHLSTISADEWDEQMALNLRAPWLCAREAAVLMSNSGGCIVNITDSGAIRFIFSAKTRSRCSRNCWPAPWVRIFG